jgi:hypothetical protein
MGRGEGTLGRLGKGSAGAGASSGSGGNVATADDALKNKVKTMEEMDEQRKLARAAERELKVRAASGKARARATLERPKSFALTFRAAPFSRAPSSPLHPPPPSRPHAGAAPAGA